ncbi:MAG: hypothetical protein PUG60_13045 [Lachnospiraceae bacterium]|nr:hypothetical protein [Lachnospiraceae bacterium]MDY4970393.1 hypothetical protein [Lachnospiraceae bacterium]
MILREQIQECVCTIQNKDLEWKSCNTMPLNILKPINISPKQLKNAEKNYLRGCPQDDIVLMVDLTFFGGGKAGYVFSTDAFYCNELAALKKEMEYPLKYSSLKSVSKGSRESRLLFILKDGTQKDVFFSIYANFVCVALNRIIETENKNEHIRNVDPDMQDEQLKLEKIAALDRILEQLAERKYRTQVKKPEIMIEKLEIGVKKPEIRQEYYEYYLQYMTLARLPEEQ